MSITSARLDNADLTHLDIESLHLVKIPIRLLCKLRWLTYEVALASFQDNTFTGVGM